MNNENSENTTMNVNMDSSSLFGNDDTGMSKDEAEDEPCHPYGDTYPCPPSYKTHSDINDILESSTDVPGLKLIDECNEYHSDYAVMFM